MALVAHDVVINNNATQFLSGISTDDIYFDLALINEKRIPKVVGLYIRGNNGRHGRKRRLLNRQLLFFAIMRHHGPLMFGLLFRGVGATESKRFRRGKGGGNVKLRPLIDELDRLLDDVVCANGSSGLEEEESKLFLLIVTVLLAIRAMPRLWSPLVDDEVIGGFVGEAVWTFAALPKVAVPFKGLNFGDEPPFALEAKDVPVLALLEPALASGWSATSLVRPQQQKPLAGALELSVTSFPCR